MRTRNERLTEKCRIAMVGGDWWTIAQMALVLGCSECTASARIRDQRKSRFGGHKIVKRLRPGGYYEYRMVTDDHITEARRAKHG